jgi:hypothetical protein
MTAATSAAVYGASCGAHQQLEGVWHPPATRPGLLTCTCSNPTHPWRRAHLSLEP